MLIYFMYFPHPMEYWENLLIISAVHCSKFTVLIHKTLNELYMLTHYILKLPLKSGHY